MHTNFNRVGCRRDSASVGEGCGHHPAVPHWAGRTVLMVLLGAGLLGGCGKPVVADGPPKNAGGAVAGSSEPMTARRFREIVATPGDATPLVPQLAAIPLWTNAVVTNVMTYATGKVVCEELTPTGKTVGGKYVVFTAQSPFYHQLMSSLLTYDEKAGTLKSYGLYGDGHGGDLVVESVGAYDYTNKTYTMTAAYGDGFEETMTGAYSDRECTDRSVVKQHGVLFMTRETKTRPATAK